MKTNGNHDAFLAHARRAKSEGFLHGSLEALFEVQPDGESAVRALVSQLKREV